MYKVNKIEVGEFEVFDSGCVTSLTGRDVIFTIDQDVRITLHFETDKNMPQGINSTFKGNNLTINFVNFNNTLGTELTNPIKIGSINGRDLYCHFRVMCMTDSWNRVIFYSWLLGNNISNGE